MYKVLISFIGNNDCYLKDNKPGAIVSLLHKVPFDKVYLLYNKNSYLIYGEEIKSYCHRFFPKIEVAFQRAISHDPTDYNLVYPAMYKAVKEIIALEKGNAPLYTVSVTSGTPTMHACWMFLKQGGVIDAELVQISRESGLKEISFALDDFPQIQTEKEIKINMTLLERENRNLKTQIQIQDDVIIGQHPLILEAIEKLNRLAKYDIPVFIGGESGTGKELAANHLHIHSNRKEFPFVPVNCGSISENLFESEFFGHKKGSFTGAISDHDGFFVQADKGTLFLDEIADLPQQMQVKLLRVLETGKIQPVGGKPISVNVRVITASNRRLSELVKQNIFREDLYYRLAQAEVDLPSLRDRGTDIILLARHFLEEYSRINELWKTLDKEAEKALLRYNWTGNVRQLRNIIRLAYINSETEVIHLIDLSFPSDYQNESEVFIPSEGIDLDGKVIPAYYKAALKIANGNASRAARLLGLQPHTFRARLHKGKNNYRNR